MNGRNKICLLNFEMMSILYIFVQYMNVYTDVTSVIYFLKVSDKISNAKIYISWCISPI